MSKVEITAALPGHLGNLTPEEEVKLQAAWIHLLRLCGVEQSVDHPTPDRTSEFRQQLLTSDASADGLRQRLWSFVLADHPDVMVLRFLRARKWDVDRAMDMLVSALNWRHERRLEDDVVRRGDSVGLLPADKLSDDERGFMAQYRSGKAYVRGTDREGRPVFVIKVRLHDPKLQSPESMEMFVLHNIETIRAMIRHPHEKACLIFDLTGFGVKNMDFHVVKFLVQVFEARYPEYLGVVLVHNAPFIFWGIWKIIRPWLDPVIASKINFTNGKSDISRFIAPENLQKCYGGEDAWEYKYAEPAEGENARMESEKKQEMLAERGNLIRQFEQVSVEWAKLEAASAEGKQKAEERDALARQLGESYWRLDPYVRARTYYHRVGVISETGQVDYKAAR